MVGRLTFTIRGAKEMEKALKAFGPQVASKLGDKALKAAARPIVREAKRLVPRRTGALQKSITAVSSRKGRASNERQVLIGFRPPASRRAHFIEFGTRHHSARPFMRPALDSKHHEALTAMAKVLADGIARGVHRGIAEAAGVEFSEFD